MFTAVLLCTCRSTPNPDTTTVTLSGWQSNPIEQQLLRQVLADFQAKHPLLKVKYEVISDQYMDVIKTRLVADAAADVFFLDSAEAPLLMSRGVLEPLESYITEDFEVADFEAKLLNVFKHQGRIYGFPKDFSTLALFYNKQAFQAAGLTAPPKTWSEFLQYAEKLTVDQDGDGKIDQYGFGLAPELSRQQFMIKAFGGSLTDSKGYAAFASPSAIKGLELIVDQYRQDKTAVLPSDVGTSAGAEMFGQGKVAMVIEGNWAIPYLNETFPQLQFGTVEVPTVNRQPGAMVYTVAYVMNQQAKHKQAAWELLSYLTGKEGMKAWTSKGLALPTRKSVAEELGYDQDPLRRALVAGISYATPWQAGENLPLIALNFNNQFTSALLGQQSLQQAMQQAQETANQEIRVSQ